MITLVVSTMRAKCQYLVSLRLRAVLEFSLEITKSSVSL